MHNVLAKSFIAAATDAATTFDVASIMQEATTSVSSQIYTTLGIIVPVIVGIVGVIVAVKFGIKWLKSLGKG